MEEEFEYHFDYIKWYLMCFDNLKMPTKKTLRWERIERRIARMVQDGDTIEDALVLLKQDFETVKKGFDRFEVKLRNVIWGGEESLIKERATWLQSWFGYYAEAYLVFVHFFLEENPGHSFPFDIP